MADRARRLDPPLLTEGPLSGAVFVVTVGRQLENGMVESTTKFDVTDQFDALARRRGWMPPDQVFEAFLGGYEAVDDGDVDEASVQASYDEWRRR